MKAILKVVKKDLILSEYLLWSIEQCEFSGQISRDFHSS